MLSSFYSPFQAKYWIDPYCPPNKKKLCLELKNVFQICYRRTKYFFSKLYGHLPQVFTSKPVKEQSCLYLTVIFYLCYYSNGFCCKEISHWKKKQNVQTQHVEQSNLMSDPRIICFSSSVSKPLT